ncbi:MAG: patatin-like phospholipase family protein [Aquamicrobium sp.]|uniref:patatin-like phospholipase family protein n=1 Tax=Aquamicrobium sp. TaxID=1872579 RepID=UPI00349EFC52|nr:patatin-like phospholipase family protein [Aquamicrobium sp.]
MAHYRVGLALGGGAARGWSHIGVIEALVEAGIEPVAVAGTSMGALVGAAHAAGRLDALKEWALVVDWRTIVSLVDLGLAGGGIVEGQRIRALLGQLGIDGEIRSFPVPFAAVATDLADGREIWLQDGPADLAIRASISMPGIFSPVLAGERWLVDGGLVNQVPVSTCRAMGADFVIAVHVGDGLLGRRRERLRVDPEGDAAALAARVAQMLEQVPFALRETAGRVLPHLMRTETRAPGYFDVLVNSLNIMQEKINRSRLAGEPPHILIAPDVATINLLDFDRAAEAIAAGRAAAEKALDAIRELMAR